MPRRTIFSLFLLAATALAAGDHEVIAIWPASALAPNAGSEKEIVTESANHERHVTNVNNPTITVYLPPKEKANGAAVVICPGGGHRFLSVDQEGYRVAEWFNSIGVAAFVLKYRLAKAEGSHYTVENSVEDAQQSIHLIRSRAAEWGIDPARVGIVGFSAGGEIAARVETKPDSEGKRPDFAVIVYPGMNQGVLDQVTKDAPPTFLIVAGDDRAHVPGTVNFYLALEKAQVPAELHIYSRGGHGFGIRDSNHSPAASWPERVKDWMSDRGLLTSKNS